MSCVARLRLGGGGEGVEVLHELGLVHTLRGDPVEDGLGFLQALALDVDGIEHLGVQLLDQAHRFQGVEEALLGCEAAMERDRHASEQYVLGQVLHPGFQRGFEGVAVRAVVPEEFDHLDLAGRCLDRRRLVQRQVLRAGLWHAAHHLGRGSGLGPDRRSQNGTAGQGKVTTFHLQVLLGIRIRGRSAGKVQRCARTRAVS